MAYVADATNTLAPADTDFAVVTATELRTLKSYLQAQLAAFGAPISSLNLRNRNLIINGNFDLWQYSTGPVTADGYVAANRWQYYSTGTTKSVTRSSFAVAQTAVPNAPTYYSTTAVTSVAGAGNFCMQSYKGEGVNKSSGRTVTVSFWYKSASAGQKIAIEGFQNFGTGGSPTAQTVGITPTQFTTNTTWQKAVVTTTFPTLTGSEVLGTNGDDGFGFNIWFDAGTSFNARASSIGQQSGTFDIAQVQAEYGGAASTFEYQRPEEIIAACGRYLPYYAFNNGDYLPYVGSVLIAGLAATQYSIPFRIKARKAPTGMVAGTASNLSEQITGSATLNAISAVTFITASVELATIQATHVAYGATYNGMLKCVNAGGYIIYFTGCEI